MAKTTITNTAWTDVTTALSLSAGDKTVFQFAGGGQVFFVESTTEPELTDRDVVLQPLPDYWGNVQENGDVKLWAIAYDRSSVVLLSGKGA